MIDHLRDTPEAAFGGICLKEGYCSERRKEDD